MSKRISKAVELNDPVFLGRAVERLSSLIEDQSATVLQAHGVTIPVKSCSLVSVLAVHGAATAAELARSLDISHQLVLQKIPKLLKLGLIETRQDEDARKRMFALTAEGMSQYRRFRTSSATIRRAYSELFAEIGDVFDLASKATQALQRQSLAERSGIMALRRT